jgi:hypothetical protein
VHAVRLVGDLFFIICRKAEIKGGGFFHMKRKIISALLCATMAATLFAGCGSSESGDAGSTGTSDESTGGTDSSDAGSGD